MNYDLWISNYTDPTTDQRCDLGVKDGVITHLSAHAQDDISMNNAAARVEADGRMLLPGLVEPHIHLDKAFLSRRMTREATSLGDAIGMTAELKRGYTVEDIIERSVAVIERSIQSGVTHLRCQVEIDPIIGLKSMEAAIQVRERVKHAMNIQLVVFPQEGIFQQAGTEQLMKQALEMGGDAVGGIPYNDLDPLTHLDCVFGMAAKYGKPVDLHVDFSDDPQDRTILDIAKRAIDYDMRGKVCVAHLTSLGSMLPADAQFIAERMAEAQISVITLPATDLYLGGRGDSYKPRRGLTPVRLLQEAGVNVCLGSNNIRNAFTPFGTGDPLDIAYLLAQTAYMGTKQDAIELLRMCTTRAAAAMNLENYQGIQVGAAADFVLTAARDVTDLIYDRSPERIVWKSGICTADTTISRSLTAVHEA